MGLYNGIPITVVGSIPKMAVPTESPSRRRAEEDARLEAAHAPNTSGCRTRQKRSAPRAL